MKLRYLSLEDAPPLKKLAIPFWQEMVLGRACAIRFVVGVNGSGKSRLLQALAQIFLTVQNFPAAQLPFFVTLVYDLGKGKDKKTIFLQYQKSESQTTPELKLYRYDYLKEDRKYHWENLPDEVSDVHFEEYSRSSSNNSLFLPQALIAYTSGVTHPWRKIFTPPLPPISIPQLEKNEERPLDWSISQERRNLREQGLIDSADELSFYDIESERESSAPSIGYFIEAKQLKLVILAVTLKQALEDFQLMKSKAEEEVLLKKWEESVLDDNQQSGFRGLLNEIGWQFPVTIGLKLDFEPDDWNNFETKKITELYKVASRVVAEAIPSNERVLFFDLKEKQGQKLLIEKLINQFGKTEKTKVTPFDIFKKLYRWQEIGLLKDVVISLKKRGVDDLMLYDWLSDGEQLFLGRMALFHLLEGEDDALALLDEPETHFNDVWKRRIVDVIDDSLRDRHNEIVISTHSSIALTDVFRKEVTRLEFNAREGSSNYRPNTVDTFGAAPTVIMREIFGAPESVGQRATEFLDLILLLATKPKEVNAIWEVKTSEKSIAKSLEINQLIRYVQEAQSNKELPHDLGGGKDLREYLIKILISVKKYVKKVQNIQNVTVVEALITLEDNIGEGYYQFEFRRRLRALRKLENHVT